MCPTAALVLCEAGPSEQGTGNGRSNGNGDIAVSNHGAFLLAHWSLFAINESRAFGENQGQML
jgi:hypothetical protein